MMYIWIAIGIVIVSYLLFGKSSKNTITASKELLNVISVAEGSQDSLKVSVFSYNTLARIYENYQNVPEEYRDFRFRINKISSLISKVKSDFICLQEVDTYNEQFNEILHSNGYESIYVKRPRLYHSDGCVLAWKNQHWDMVFLKHIDFNTSPYAQTNSDFHRDNVGVIGLFQHKATAKRVIVATTHFFWDPNYEHVKYGQASMLLDHINRLSLEEVDAPVIVCGDFNSLPDSNVLRVFYGQAPVKLDQIKQENFNIIQEFYKPRQMIFKSVYSLYKDSPYPFTNCTKDFKGCIDHIMYTSSLKPISLLEVPYDESFTELGLPNINQPSDHLPIMAYFELV